MANTYQQNVKTLIIETLKKNNGVANSYKGLAQLMGVKFTTGIYSAVKSLVVEGKVKTVQTKNSTHAHDIILCETLTNQLPTNKLSIEQLVLETIKANNGFVESYTALANLTGKKYHEVHSAVKKLVAEGTVKLEIGVNNACNISLGNHQKNEEKELTFNTTNLHQRILIALKANNGFVDSYSALAKMVGHHRHQVYYAVQSLIKQGVVKTESKKDNHNVLCTNILLGKANKQAQIKEIEIKEVQDDIRESVMNILDKYKKLEVECNKVKIDYSELEARHKNLLKAFEEMSNKYHTAISQLGGFSTLQQDILLMAKRIKAN